MEQVKHRPVLVVDDDTAVAQSIALTLHGDGYKTVVERSLSGARKALGVSEFAAVITDLYLGSASGRDVLAAVGETSPLTPVIVISGVATLEEALEVVRGGAFDFIEKPVRAERLLVALENAMRLRSLRSRSLGDVLSEFKSEAMKKVMSQLRRLAGTKVTVLINGESGTGKDVAARLLHALSPWGEKPLVKINCGAIPEGLIESELFGHKKGSFTGAVSDADGRISAAAGGTLFLDEVGELPASAQVKLLRFLETGEIQRVGDTTTLVVDTRIVAATNRNLEEMVQTGKFREDLYYRLSIVPVFLPPLRDRRADIPALAEFFLDTLATRHGVVRPPMTEQLLAYLEVHPMPGNIRSLRSVLERLVVLGEVPDAEADPHADSELESLLSQDFKLTEARRTLEAAYIRRALHRHGNSVKRTAEALDVLPNNLARRITELGLRT